MRSHEFSNFKRNEVAFLVGSLVLLRNPSNAFDSVQKDYSPVQGVRPKKTSKNSRLVETALEISTLEIYRARDVAASVPSPSSESVSALPERPCSRCTCNTCNTCSAANHLFSAVISSTLETLQKTTHFKLLLMKKPSGIEEHWKCPFILRTKRSATKLK